MHHQDDTIGLPDNMQFFHRGTHIIITRKWMQTKIIFMTLFLVFWFSYIANWVNHIPENSPLPQKLFPLIFIFAGLAAGYYTLAGWLNKTRIRVGEGKLLIRHGPVPWTGNVTRNCNDIKQLYVTERLITSRNGNSLSYELHAITHNNKNLLLLGGIPKSEQALFMEEKIEQFLKIRDIPVKGEFGKRPDSG